MSADHPDVGALAITLSPRDGVTIGPDIEVYFVKSISNSEDVRLLIRAPKSVEISRFRRRRDKPLAPNKPVDELEETLRMVRTAAQ